MPVRSKLFVAIAMTFLTTTIVSHQANADLCGPGEYAMDAGVVQAWGYASSDLYLPWSEIPAMVQAETRVAAKADTLSNLQEECKAHTNGAGVLMGTPIFYLDINTWQGGPGLLVPMSQFWTVRYSGSAQCGVCTPPVPF